MIDIAKDIQQDLERSFSPSSCRKAENVALKRIDTLKNKATRSGKTMAVGGRYNNQYNRQYAQREKGGRRSPVTLRNTTNSIEETKIIKNKESSSLKFVNRNKGVIFNLHDEGKAKGSKHRQVYPHQDSQVPKEIDKMVERSLLNSWQKTPV